MQRPCGQLGRNISFSETALWLVREQHSGLLACTFAIQQWVLDGLGGNQAMLVRDGAFGLVGTGP